MASATLNDGAAQCLLCCWCPLGIQVLDTVSICGSLILSPATAIPEEKRQYATWTAVVWIFRENWARTLEAESKKRLGLDFHLHIPVRPRTPEMKTIGSCSISLRITRTRREVHMAVYMGGNDIEDRKEHQRWLGSSA